MRSHGRDIAALSDENNTNAQVAALNLQLWADELDALLVEPPSAQEPTVSTVPPLVAPAPKVPNLMGLYSKVVNVLRSERNTGEQEIAIGKLFDELTDKD
jgi:hypothetical protein